MSQPSLLSFLDAPVVVGDPDGRAAYVNPSFELAFSVSAEQVTGEPLASLFEGGVREAVLTSVAQVCSSGTSGRFRVKHGRVGYAGLASPIVAEDERVGVLIVFSESAPDDERVHQLQRKVAAPLEELARVFEELGGLAPLAGHEKAEGLLTSGGRAVDQLCGWAQDLSDTLSGRRPERSRPTNFDPAAVASAVAASLADSFAAADVRLDLRVPGELPGVAGQAEDMRQGLDLLLRKRLAVAVPGSKVTLAARTVEREGKVWVVLALMDVRPGGGAVDDDDSLPPDLIARVEALGGDVRVSTDPGSGRTTAIRLNALK